MALFQDVSTDPSKLAAHQSNPKVRKVMEKLASKFGGAGGPMGGGGGFPDFGGRISLFHAYSRMHYSLKVTWVELLLQQIPMISIDLSHWLPLSEQRLFLFLSFSSSANQNNHALVNVTPYFSPFFFGRVKAHESIQVGPRHITSLNTIEPDFLQF